MILFLLTLWFGFTVGFTVGLVLVTVASRPMRQTWQKDQA